VESLNTSENIISQLSCVTVPGRASFHRVCGVAAPRIAQLGGPSCDEPADRLGERYGEAEMDTAVPDAPGMAREAPDTAAPADRLGSTRARPLLAKTLWKESDRR